MKTVTDNTNQSRLFIEVIPESLGNDVIEIKSTSSNAIYRVDTVNGRCSCPAWKFKRGGTRKPCKHLLSMGITSIIRPKTPVLLSENQL